MLKTFTFVALAALSPSCLALDRNAVAVECDQPAHALQVHFGKESELSAGKRYILGDIPSGTTVVCRLGAVAYTARLSAVVGDGTGICGADVEKVRVVVERERRKRVAKFLLPFCPGYPLPHLVVTVDAANDRLSLPDEIAEWAWQRDPQ